jgi:hypothetical protein
MNDWCGVYETQFKKIKSYNNPDMEEELDRISKEYSEKRDSFLKGRCNND